MKSIPADFKMTSKLKNKRDCSRYYNVSMSVVTRWEHTLGIKCIHNRSDSLKDRNLTIVDLYMNKMMSMIEIAKIYNISRQRVYKIINKTKLEVRNE